MQKRHLGDNDDTEGPWWWPWWWPWSGDGDGYGDIAEDSQPYYPDDAEGTSLSLQFTLAQPTSELIIDFYRLRALDGSNPVDIDGDPVGTLNGGDSVDLGADPYTLSVADNWSAGTHTLTINSESVSWNDNDDFSWDQIIITPTLVPEIDHFRIEHDRYGINCIPENVTVTVVNYDGTIASDYTGSVTLTTDSDNGNWLPGSGYGSLVDTTDDDGMATYTFAADDNGSVTMALLNAHDESVNIAVSDGIITDDDTEGLLDFNPVGFEVSPNPVGTQISCETFTLTFTAVGQTEEHPECGVITEYTGNKQLKFWFDYNEPSTGNVTPTINNQPVATSAPESGQNINFAAGVATVEAKYSDAGKIQIYARDDVGIGDPLTGTANEVIGGIGPFVVAPDHFEVTSTLNNTSSNGDPKGVAGLPFTATIQAVCADGTETPNFAWPTKLDISAFQPSEEDGGREGDLSITNPSDPDDENKLLSEDFTDGAASTELIYTEVGNFTLKAESTDYLYSGMDISGTAVVGRFYPHHFELTPVDLTNRVESGCSDSTFTYMGENLEFTYTLTAINANGDITENYIGSFAKFEGETTSADYSIGAAGNIPDGSTTDLTSRLAIINVSRVADWTVGNAGFKVKLNVDRLNQPDGPFTDTRFGVFVRDSDEVEIEPLDLDVDIDGSDDYAQAATSTLLRYGRIRLENAHGSELLPLAMPIFIEYYKDGSFRFNTHDTCTKLTHASETDHIPFKLAQDEDSEDTDWSDANQEIDLVGSGNTQSLGFSEVSNAPSSPYIISSNTTLDNDPTNLILSPPGAGNTGHIFMHADLSDYPFLQYDWNGDDNYDDNPTARATFGIYKGNERIIYLRETTWR
jgi:MSHA biogenesis protein MshQ